MAQRRCDSDELDRDKGVGLHKTEHICSGRSDHILEYA